MTSGSGNQGDGMDGQHVPVTDRKAKTKRDRRGGIVLSAGLVGAGAVFAVMMLGSGPTSSAASPAAPPFPAHATTAPSDMADMPGMDHGSGIPTSSPSPTATGDSPWNTHDDSGTTSHTHGAPAKPVDRPLAPVLGVFGGGASTVMLSAGLLRRRDRARGQAKQAARDSGRGRK